MIQMLSGNLTGANSHHLPQFAIIPNMPGNTTDNRFNICVIETGANLIEKILFLFIFLLNGGIC